MTPPSVRRILVVDDNPATLYSTSRVLRSAGFEVIEAKTGVAALALAEPSIDLVILDINLPDMDGYEICRILRNKPETHRISLVHLSATFVTDDYKVLGFEAGADGYLTHPVEPMVLVGTVKALLRTRDAEDLMRSSEAKLKAIFEHAPSGIALLGEELTYLDVNPAMCRLLARSREDIIGTRVVDQPPSGYSRDDSWHGVLPVTRGDGRVIEIEWHISVHPAPGLQLAIATDITDRRLIEADRERLLSSERAARSEAERANRLKDEFLATLSHELRNPLNAILGWATTLRRQYDLPGLAQGLQTIERNARIQAQLISDLLDVSRITAGKMRLDTEVVDLSSLIDAAIEVVRAAADAKGIRIERTLSQDIAPLWGDPARLQQVVWNLVTNAVKFTPNGGTVTVALRRRDDHLLLSVADNGRGIAPEFLPHIFERFRQEDATITRSQSGLGLGLAIVKHLVEMHGGTVTARSEGEGLGATFEISLPLGLATAAVRRSLPGVDRSALELDPLVLSSDLAGARVLVVEDDDDARLLYCRVLSERGAVVTQASSVPSALEELEREVPDVLISDIGMPGQDGYVLIRTVRARGCDARTLPAIALTAFARLEDRRQALLAGFQQHLGKPVDPEELVATVGSLLTRRPDPSAGPER